MRKQTEREEIIELAKNVGVLNQQLGTVQQTIDKLDKKIDELTKQGEDLLEVKLKQQQLDNTLIEIKNKNVDLELRVNVLEDAEGKRAKAVISKVGYLVLSAFVGAVLFNIKDIISSLGGK